MTDSRLPLSETPAFLRAQAVVARLAELAALEPRACAWPMRRGGGTVVVGEDPSRPGRWRATVLDASGTPTGHSEAPGYPEAVRTAHHLGADVLAEPVPCS